MATIVFAAGGTGGHLIPALILARHISKKLPHINILFVVSGNDLEKDLMTKSEFDYVIQTSEGVVGKGVSGVVSFAKRFLLNFKSNQELFKNKHVKLVIGFGGFPSFMPVLSAAITGIKTFVFEQNAKAGLANQTLSLVATKVFAVPGSSGILSNKVIRILNPVREDIKEVKAWSTPKEKTINILIVGGSQGAYSLNTEISKLKNFFSLRDCHVVHQTGKRDYQRMEELYADCTKITPIPFIENMAKALEEAHLVICRAGAGAVAEVTSTKRPAIFVPLSLAKGHQKYNAMHLVRGGAAFLFDQNDGLSDKLILTLKNLMDNPQELSLMHQAYFDIVELKNVKDGAEVISDEVLLLDSIQIDER